MKEPIKLWRSPRTCFGAVPQDLDDGGDETMTAVNAYTDEELKGIAQAGFNGIWVHGLLRNLVPSSVFPEFGRLSAQHLQALRTLIDRAAVHGIKVYLYMQPPRAIPATSSFWKQHPDAAGNDEPWGENALRNLCTSTPKVRQFLRESSETLTRSLPGLGGIVMITASEYPSHCWARSGNVLDAFGKASGYRVTKCPRCSQRSPVDIVAEVIRLVRDGAKAGNPDVNIIAWNWSWNAYDPDPSPQIINSLPEDVIMMADFERGGTKTILGKERVIDEYSLSFSGPSERFLGSTHCAAERGMLQMAKLQISTTHELATVANLPLIANLYDKAHYLKQHRLAGFMGCWNFGNMRTANTAGFNYFLSPESPDNKREALIEFAKTYFPGCQPSKVADAWETFSRAADHYPFSIPFLYASPINYAPIFPLKPGPIVDPRPCGPSWHWVDDRGECLEASLGPFTVDEIIEGFTRLEAIWREGLVLLEAGLKGSSSPHAAEELNNARVCAHVFRSTANIYRCWKLRLNWNDDLLPEYRKIASDEKEHLRGLIPILQADPRQGFHGEGFTHFFNADKVSAKIRELEEQLNHLLS